MPAFYNWLRKRTCVTCGQPYVTQSGTTGECAVCRNSADGQRRRDGTQGAEGAGVSAGAAVPTIRRNRAETALGESDSVGHPGLRDSR